LSEGLVARKLIAWGGIVQGLLDFHNIGSDELSDVFGSIAATEAALVTFHKGSLISIGGEPLSFIAFDERRKSPIGVSPYLALPHAVVLHNEERLRRARAVSPRVGALADRPSIDKTSQYLGFRRDAVSSFLQNVFHYPAEKNLYESGRVARSLDDMYVETEALIDTEESDLDERRKRRDVRLVLATIFLAVVFGAQGALAQAKPLFPYFLLPTIGLLNFLGAVVWALRQ
jgi:hypothetical protein